ncbi:hypothetical protein [Amycolatopsis sp. CA-230715]|uniref:hypothetical protein n=1 Tax=Amycolatopsis sp. CA-230715 TaxID=2745196 RepID=UPI001C02C3F9|nr:hypothetical protein [Amycolatopsis sp. CA-230715]QWF77800.1 hypothetical protein HUW46_01193 [Amycolatopsis sp. CA-230715]
MTPNVVWHGDGGCPTVLVLDPAGAANHGELPATWRDLAERRQVVWCRLSEDGALSEAFELLADPDVLTRPVDVVTSGPVAGTVLELVSRRPAAVRSLLLVDPAAEDTGARDDAAPADERWAESVRSVRQAAEADGVTVAVIAHSTPSEEDRVPPPLPLGHPDVVAAVARTTADLDESPRP